MESEFNDLDAKSGWAALYQLIRNESGQFDYTIKEAKKVENKNLNRYRDVSPYDHSRVKLLQGDHGDYINASLLDVPDAHRAYILTQGPLPNTTSHFWQMVWEQNSKAVLMLNKVIEKNTIKCHQYWPLGSINNGEDCLDLDSVGLRVEYVSENEASAYTLRHLRLSNVKSEESRIVLHFHYTTWPDFSVPQSPSAFLNFLFAVRASGALDENVGPPVVHCSAGIGRSGTFCLVDSCLVLIEKHQDLNAINVKTMLLEMRKYRMGLIQTPDQLRFSYWAILEGSQRVINQRSIDGSGSSETSDVDTDISENADDVEIKDERSTNSGSSEDIREINKDDGEFVPLLPAKRKRIEVSEGSEVLVECNSVKEVDGGCTQNNNAVKEDSENHGNHVNATQDGKDSQNPCSMTMKDGAVVTNFNEKLKAAEVRRRLQKEKNAKMIQKVKEIQQKQQASEKWQSRKAFLKPISVSLLLLLGGGYLVYRYFLKD